MTLALLPGGGPPEAPHMGGYPPPQTPGPPKGGVVDGWRG